MTNFVLIMRVNIIGSLAILLGAWSVTHHAIAKENESVPAHEADNPASSKDLVDAVRQAFAKTHDGWSSDEVLLQDELRQRFLEECRRRFPNDGSDDRFCVALLNLRKTGNLNQKVTKRKPIRHDDYRHAAEIAARFLEDKYGANTDAILTSETFRRKFDELAKELAPDVPPYRLRKAAVGLRKARKLKPEFVLRIADWGRQIETYSVDELKHDPSRIPSNPGIYIFRDKTGYLYVGESDNLRNRLAKHLSFSDRHSLANYLADENRTGIVVEIHSFSPSSQAKLARMRRAYESEIIASRKPRFNIRP